MVATRKLLGQKLPQWRRDVDELENRILEVSWLMKEEEEKKKKKKNGGGCLLEEKGRGQGYGFRGALFCRKEEEEESLGKIEKEREIEF